MVGMGPVLSWRAGLLFSFRVQNNPPGRLGYARTLDLFVSEAVAAEREVVSVSVLDPQSPEIARNWSNEEEVSNFVFLTRSGRYDSARTVASGKRRNMLTTAVDKRVFLIPDLVAYDLLFSGRLSCLSGNLTRTGLLAPCCYTLLPIVVRSVVDSTPGVNFVVLVVPFSSRMVEAALEDAGVFADVILQELPLGFFGLGEDLLTLDWSGGMRELSREADECLISSCISAAIALESIANIRFRILRSAGHFADTVITGVYNAVKRRYDRPQSSSPDALTINTACAYARYAKGHGPQVHDDKVDDDCGAEQALLLVVDRATDLVTPLLTQWSYEGMLDEVFGMTNSVVEVNSKILGDDAGASYGSDLFGALPMQNKDLVRKKFDSQDSVFQQVRDLNFAVATKRLGNVASGLRSFYAARPSERNSDIDEVRNYVQNLGAIKEEHKYASVHTSLASEISSQTFENGTFRRNFEVEQRLLDGRIDLRTWKSHVLACIESQARVTRVLRVVALWSQTKGPIPRQTLNEIYKAIQQAYGIEWLPLLFRAEETGIILHAEQEQEPGWMMAFEGSKRREGAEYSWIMSRDHMKLLRDYDPEQTEQEEDAPYSGFVPVIARLVQYGLERNGWPSVINRRLAQKSLLPEGQSANERVLGSVPTFPRHAVIIFLGGATRAELSAVRILLRRAYPDLKAILAPTSILSGDSLFAELLFSSPSST